MTISVSGSLSDRISESVRAQRCGARSAGDMEASERGRRVLRSERYEVRTALANGNEVALEVLWVGTLAVAIGSLAPGDEMRAHFGVFLTFRDGLITRQRNYDCFDPF
jgi:hypothetical protein